MKKITATAGLAAVGVLGVTGAHAQGYSLAPGLTQQELAKPWSISAALRGFYDDNSTTGSGANKVDSFGFEISPGISLNLPMDQTYIGLSYVYSFRYFEGRSQGKDDQSHIFNAKLNHAFTERHRLEVTDQFVVSQEPTVLDGGTLARVDGDNIRNRAMVSFHAGITPKVSVVGSYGNTYVNYEQSGTGSLSARLDRLEHLISIDGRCQFLPTTTALVGYQFGLVDFTSDDLLTAGPPPLAPDIRNSRSHYFFAGADHAILPELTGSIRAGVQYVDYYDAPAGFTQDDLSPYLDASLSWTYLPGSHTQVGFRYQRTQTDLAVLAGGGVVQDSETATVYGAVTHQITPDVTASVLGQYGNYSYEGTGIGDLTDNLFLVGLNLAYRINQFLSAETGYNYDRVSSDVAGRSYSRNRVYIGLRATY